MWGQWRGLGVGSRTSANTRRRLSGSGVGQANVGVGVRVATHNQRRLAWSRPVSGAIEREDAVVNVWEAGVVQPAQHRTQGGAVCDGGKCHDVLQQNKPAGLWCQCGEHVANEPQIARPVPGATEAATGKTACEYVVRW
jgi:hypothetical protein